MPFTLSRCLFEKEWSAAKANVDTNTRATWLPCFSSQVTGQGCRRNLRKRPQLSYIRRSTLFQSSWRQKIALLQRPAHLVERAERNERRQRIGLMYPSSQPKPHFRSLFDTPSYLLNHYFGPLKSRAIRNRPERHACNIDRRISLWQAVVLTPSPAVWTCTACCCPHVLEPQF